MLGNLSALPLPTSIEQISVLLYTLRNAQSEYLFALSLILNVPLAFFIPYIPPGLLKRSAYTVAVGFSTCLIFSGYGIFNYFICITISYLLAKQLHKRKWSGLAVFLFAFGYVGFVRFLRERGLLHINNTADTCFLIMCLKVVNFAYYLQDGDTTHNTSFTSFIRYILFFPGLWSGPYLDFSSVSAALESRHSKRMSCRSAIINKLFTNSIYIALYFGLKKLWTYNDIMGDAFALLPWTGKIFMLRVVMIKARSRYIFCWTVADIACILAGVACDNTKKNLVDEDKVVSIKVGGLDLGTSIQQVCHSWNRHVQSWLVLHIYKRCPYKSRLFRRILVMVVSAYWHGMKVGHTITFIGLAVGQLAQEGLWNREWPFEKVPIISFFYATVKWLITQLLMDFFTVAFLLPNAAAALGVYRALHFYGIYICLFLIPLSWVADVYKTPAAKTTPVAQKAN